MAAANQPYQKMFAELITATTRYPEQFKSRIRTLVLTPINKPRVKLPDPSVCAGCLNASQRPAADMSTEIPEDFMDLVKTGDASVGASPPKMLRGMDCADGPHQVVDPGFEDMARIIEPSDLTTALSANSIMPSCTCAQALFDAADDTFFDGIRLNQLRGVHDGTIKPEPPRPKPTKISRLDIGGLTGTGDLFTAFGIEID